MPARGGLPVIGSCDGCGACCRAVATPPFVRHLDGTGEEAWERLRWDRPDLRAAILDAERAHRPLGPPCPWFDPATARCRHYEHRPRACRDFAVGGVDCLDTRRRAGIDAPGAAGRATTDRAPRGPTASVEAAPRAGCRPLPEARGS